MKPGGVAAEARGAITTETAQFLSDDDGNEDPFAELVENKDELSENETVLEDC